MRTHTETETEGQRSTKLSPYFQSLSLEGKEMAVNVLTFVIDRKASMLTAVLPLNASKQSLMMFSLLLANCF